MASARWAARLMAATLMGSYPGVEQFTHSVEDHSVEDHSVEDHSVEEESYVTA